MEMDQFLDDEALKGQNAPPVMDAPPPLGEIPPNYYDDMPPIDAYDDNYPPDEVYQDEPVYTPQPTYQANNVPPLSQPTQTAVEDPSMQYEPEQSVKSDISPSFKKGYTLAQLAGKEGVNDDLDLSLARIQMFRDMASLTETEALQKLTDSQLVNGQANESRADLAALAMEQFQNESMMFAKLSMKKITESIQEGKAANIPHLDGDKTLLPDLLKYHKSGIGSGLVTAIREDNKAVIVEQYKSGQPQMQYQQLVNKQAEVIEKLTGVSTKDQDLNKQIGSRDVLFDVVKHDLEVAKDDPTFYETIVKNALANRDYLKSLDSNLYQEFKQEGQGKTYAFFLKGRLDEINKHSELQLEVAKHGKKVELSTPKVATDLYKELKGESNAHIASVLNGTFTHQPQEKAEQTQKATKEQQEKEALRQKEEQALLEKYRDKPLYFHSFYYGAKGLAEGFFKGLGGKPKESAIQLINGLQEKAVAFKDKATAFIKDKAPEVKNASGTLSKEVKDTFNKAKDFYYKRTPITEAERAVYKPTHNIDGLNVSRRLSTSEFKQEIGKLNDYTIAMKGAALNPKNSDYVYNKMQNFHTYFNNTVNKFSDEKGESMESFVKKTQGRMEARVAANEVLGEYQKLSRDVLSNQNLTLAERQDKYDVLSKRSLGMAQKFAQPSSELLGNTEKAAYAVYKDSVYLKHYANDLANRKALGLDTSEIERRIDKRIASLEKGQMELSQMIKAGNIQGQFSNNPNEVNKQANISMVKTEEYLRLSEALQTEAFRNKELKDKEKKLKDKDFSMDKVMEDLQSNLNKMLDSITSVFKHSNKMGAQV